MTLRSRILGAFLLLLPLTARAADARKELWLYYPSNLLVEKNIDKLEDIWTRAAKAGYTHVLLADSKFSRLNAMDKRYFDNCERVKKIAKELNLTIVPAIFPIGYSNDLLSQNPNLAEGLPVKDALFVVKENLATLQPEPPVAFAEKFNFVDEEVKLDAAAHSATVTANKSNARMNQRLKLTPFRHYHVWVQIKTDDYTGHPEIKALAAADGVSLNWTNLHVKRTQDWTTHHITFNSLDHTDVNLYLGVWGSAKGTLQWKDWRIEEVGLLNVLRRPGAPLLVKQGDRMLEEGKDFDPIKDPRMGTVPYAGEYEVYHDSPAIHTHNLPDGTQLRVSWYHPHIIYDGQMPCCFAEPQVKELLADQAKRMRQLWSAPGYMMSHDEIRVMNHDLSCLSAHKTPGELLADNARYCTSLLDGATVYTWNDMFDPFHNAVKGPYYLVNGPYTGSWEGLSKDTIILNWNFGHRDESLKFFADRGHRQIIAGYYDAKPEQIKLWLASAAKVQGVIGVMYTTWRNDYSQIESFAKLARE